MLIFHWNIRMNGIGASFPITSGHAACQAALIPCRIKTENEPAAFSALLLSEDAVSAEIPALTVMVCGYDKTGGRMDMTLA